MTNETKDEWGMPQLSEQIANCFPGLVMPKDEAEPEEDNNNEEAEEVQAEEYIELPEFGV